jgi:MFS family permease
MRGRVMSLWAVVFLGSTPVGAPLVGWVAERFGPRFALGLGGMATLVAGLAAAWSLRATTTAARTATPADQPLLAIPARTYPGS